MEPEQQQSVLLLDDLALDAQRRLERLEILPLQGRHAFRVGHVKAGFQFTKSVVLG
jgi:hypothetical protein